VPLIKLSQTWLTEDLALEAKTKFVGQMVFGKTKSKDPVKLAKHICDGSQYVAAIPEILM
jgi:hypothetical protein